MAERETGTVKWFDNNKGYGFIARSNGGDVFVHLSGIRAKVSESLSEGDQVEFEVVQGDRGPKAEDVVVIG